MRTRYPQFSEPRRNPSRTRLPRTPRRRLLALLAPALLLAACQAIGSIVASISGLTFTGGNDQAAAGIFLGAPTTLTITNSTVSGNSAASGGNCFRTIHDGGYNLDSGTTCGFSAANHSLSSTDPMLDPRLLSREPGAGECADIAERRWKAAGLRSGRQQGRENRSRRLERLNRSIAKASSQAVNAYVGRRG